MNCTKCNHPLQEGDHFCKHCGDRFAIAEQKEKVNVAKGKARAILAENLHSPLFLIFAICFTVMFASQVVSMITGGITAILGGILPFIFMLIALIGLWKSYSTKSAEYINSKAVRNASIYDAYVRVMYTISMVLTIISGVIIVVLLFAAGELLAEILSLPEAEEGGMVTAIIAAIALSVGITFISLYRAIYANRRAYFVGLSQTAETGVYAMKKVPLFGSWL